MNEVIKSYKGFNKDMTCRGKQYEEGKEYEEERAEACDCGMHACEYPLDCLGYYSPNESVYHVVEQSGKISRRNDDSKIASTKMKIGAEISIAGLVKAAIEYTRERIQEHKEATGYYGASHRQRQETMAHRQRQETMAHRQRQETMAHRQRQETVAHRQRQDIRVHLKHKILKVLQFPGDIMERLVE